jgi:hypothetical protein
VAGAAAGIAFVISSDAAAADTAAKARVQTGEAMPPKRERKAMATARTAAK